MMEMSAVQYVPSILSRNVNGNALHPSHVGERDISVLPWSTNNWLAPRCLEIKTSPRHILCHLHPPDSPAARYYAIQPSSTHNFRLLPSMRCSIKHNLASRHFRCPWERRQEVHSVTAKERRRNPFFDEQQNGCVCFAGSQDKISVTPVAENGTWHVSSTWTKASPMTFCPQKRTYKTDSRFFSWRGFYVT